MSYSDERLGELFPTRHGEASGTANERQMLDVVGGASSFRTLLRVLGDGSEVMLRTKDGQPQFTTKEKEKTTPAVQKGYMTSGAFPIVRSINIPLLTYKSSAVEAVENRVLNSLYEKRPPTNEGESKLYQSSILGDSKFLAAKDTMYRKRPSEFSGLMRRLVQGQYGSGNTLRRAGPVGGTASYVEFGAEYGRTTGVVCFSGSYYLVVLETVGTALTVTGYPLLLQADHVATLASLVGQDHDAFEVYALANATALTTSAISLGTHSVPVGTPLAYGWNFSLRSNQAHVVIREDLGVNYDKHRWSHLRVVFTGDDSGISCAYSLEEQVVGMMCSSQSAIWAPSGPWGEIGDYAGMVWVNRYSAAAPIAGTAQDMPVYAFHNDDELNIVRWAYSDGGRPVDGADNQEWEDLKYYGGYAHSFFGAGSSSFAVSKDYGLSITQGFYIGGKLAPMSSYSQHYSFTGEAKVVNAEDWPGDPPAMLLYPLTDIQVSQHGSGAALGNYSDLYPRTDAHITTAEYIAQCNAAQIPWPDPWFGVTVSAWGDLVVNTTEVKSGQGHCTAMLIPYSDCCAVYLGTRRQSQATTWKTQSMGHGLLAQAEYKYEQLVQEGWTLTGVVFPKETRQCSVNGDQFNLAYVSSSVAVTSPVDIQIHLFTSDTLLIGTEESPIFQPPIDTVDLPPIEVISSALFKDKRYVVGSIAPMNRVATPGYNTECNCFIGAS